MKQLFTPFLPINFCTAILFMILFGAVPSLGQVDSSFWFAVPYVGGHGNANSELVIANMSKTKAVTVTLTNPANPAGGIPAAGIIEIIPAGGSVRINLNPYYGKNQATQAPGTLYANNPNAITDNGLLITASSAVTAYYEQGRDGNNVDLFSLKGGNALGTDFMLPFQNHYDTWNNQNSYSSADIIATENGTSITITPTRAAVGRPANVPFTIILNRGQTYSLRAASLLAANHLSGSRVSSNKPIAITLVDDSMVTSWPGAGGIDMAGDQLVPLSVIGKEYIVTRGNAGPNGDHNRIFILTTQANTNITISENGNVASTLNNLNAGVTTNYLQPTTSPASHIYSDKPIYVFYITGSDSELGGALIPPVQCTGSDAVSIVRSSNNTFSLIIVAKTKILDNFLINGINNPGFLQRSDFTTVTTTPTGEGFSVAQKTYSTAQFPTLTPMMISNNFASGGYFHIGVSNEGGNSSRFGYFSDFSSINISYANKPVCFGDSLVLDAGPNRDYYKWYAKVPSGDSILSNDQVYKVKDAGRRKIYLRIEKRNCPLEDSVDVYIQPKVNLSILRKKIACDNQPVSMDATPEVTVPPLNIVQYRWYSQTPTIPASANDTFATTQSVAAKFPVSTGTPLAPHKVFIKVTDDQGCVSTDSVEVTITPNPPVSVGSFSDAQVCSGDSVQLGFSIANPTTNKLIFDWMEDASVPPAQQDATGLNKINISNPKASKLYTTAANNKHNFYIITTDTSSSCIKIDTLVLTINPIPKPVFTGLKTAFCLSDPAITLTADAPGFTAGTAKFTIGGNVVTQFDPSSAGKGDKTIDLEYTSAEQCIGTSDTIVKVSDVPSVAMTDKEYCSGQSATIGVSPDTNFDFLWDTSPDIATPASHEVVITTTNTTTASITNTYKLTVTSKTNATCTNSGQVNVKIKPVPVASFTGILPAGHCIDSTNINLVGSHTTGVFSTTSDALTAPNTFTPKTAGSKVITYRVDIDNCVDDTTVTAEVHPLPQPIINGIDKPLYCVDEPALTITGSNPSGGTFQNNGTAWTEGNFPLTTAAIYKFRYDVTDANGCINFVEKSLEVKPIPILSLDPVDPICEGNSTTIIASGGDSYKWTGLNGNSSSLNVQPIITTTYEVKAVNTANCESQSQSVTVVVNPTPKARFAKNNITHCFEEGDVTLFAGIAPTYLWSNGATTDTLHINAGGLYKVTLTAGPCSTSDSVNVVAFCPPRVFLPTAFTPNGDGNNDQLEIFGDHFQRFEMKIFNRWGEVIYTTNDRNQPWDGTYLGEEMPVGVYPWVVTYESMAESPSEQNMAMNGSVTLIR